MRVPERKRGDLADLESKVKELSQLLTHGGWKILRTEMENGLRAKDEQLKAAVRAGAMAHQDNNHPSPEYLMGFIDAYQMLILLPAALITDFDSQLHRK